jgi:peptide deformylase
MKKFFFKIGVFLMTTLIAGVIAEERTILNVGNPILKQKTTEVEDFQDLKVKQIAADLLLTLSKMGVGVAAPQIGENLRMLGL